MISGSEADIDSFFARSRALRPPSSRAARREPVPTSSKTREPRLELGGVPTTAERLDQPGRSCRLPEPHVHERALIAEQRGLRRHDVRGSCRSRARSGRWRASMKRFAASTAASGPRAPARAGGAPPGCLRLRTRRAPSVDSWTPRASAARGCSCTPSPASPSKRCLDRGPRRAPKRSSASRTGSRRTSLVPDRTLQGESGEIGGAATPIARGTTAARAFAAPRRACARAAWTMLSGTTTGRGERTRWQVNSDAASPSRTVSACSNWARWMPMSLACASVERSCASA